MRWRLMLGLRGAAVAYMLSREPGRPAVVCAWADVCRAHHLPIIRHIHVDDSGVTLWSEGYCSGDGVRWPLQRGR